MQQESEIQKNKRSEQAGKVVLFGNAAVAATCYTRLTYDSSYEVAGFTVDRDYMQEAAYCGLPLVPFEEVSTVFPPDQYRMMVCVGFVQVNQIRADRCREAKSMGYQLINYISTQATLWPGQIIGKNCRIGSNTILQPYAKIANNVFIGDGVVIGHHTIIEDHCFIASGVMIAGGVTVGQSSFLGTGAVIRNRITIGKKNVIGAGAVILENTRERGVYLAAAAEDLGITSDKLSL